MISENKAVGTLAGLDAWDAAGINGSTAKAAGYKIGTYEQIELGHGYDTWFVVNEFVSGAPVVVMPAFEAEAFIKANKVIVAYRSFNAAESVSDNMKYAAGIQEYCLLLHSAGNDSITTNDGIGDRPEWFVVTSSSWVDLAAASYSNQSDDTLVSQVGTFYVKKGGITTPVMGTSFAAPAVAGLVYRLVDLSLIKRGFAFDGYELEKYLINLAVDVAPVGFDNKTGFGFLKLPAPGTIDVYKYMPADPAQVKLKIGSTTMVVDGVSKTIDQAPFIVEDTGRTMVPLRAVGEAFGFRVEWNETDQSIKLFKRSITTLKIGSSTITVNNIPKIIDQAPYIVPSTGRTVVPVRAICEAFGFSVSWNALTREITICK